MFVPPPSARFRKHTVPDPHVWKTAVLVLARGVHGRTSLLRTCRRHAAAPGGQAGAPVPQQGLCFPEGVHRAAGDEMLCVVRCVCKRERQGAVRFSFWGPCFVCCDACRPKNMKGEVMAGCLRGTTRSRQASEICWVSVVRGAFCRQLTLCRCCYYCSPCRKIRLLLSVSTFVTFTHEGRTRAHKKIK